MIKLYDLKTLHQSNPLGIDEIPYFSWKIESDRKNVLQKSYRIVVKDENSTVWDSGIVESDKQSFVPYEGETLTSKTAYQWNVMVWDNNEDVAVAEASFETAFLKETDWKAQWIESTIPRVSQAEYKFGGTYPPVHFEKRVQIDKEVAKARVYATAYGVYRLTLNGKRADDREFAPEYTVYDKALYYQTYDITKQLQVGENILDMYVGDGWYFSQQSQPVTEHPHESPSVLFQMEIQYADGSCDVICSDGTETVSLGKVCYADLFQGEKWDYNLTEDDKHPVQIMNYGYHHLVAQPMPPVRAIKSFPAVELIHTPAGELVVDFGQILAGKARIHIDLPKDTKVTYEYFEILSEEGNYINTMFAPQKDTVISDGNPHDFEVYFTFHGFRYIRVTGVDSVDLKDFTALLLSTEKDNLGEFETSDGRMNRLYQNVRFSQYNNMMSVPTDCPSREKAGWTGDILVYAKTALMNEDMTPFLSSWLRNVRLDQHDDGVVLITTPFARMYETVFLNAVKEFGDNKPTGVAGWSDAIVWVPYDMYRVTGNKQILVDNFQSMKAWCTYIMRTAQEKRGYKNIPEEYDKYLWNTGFHFGEWLIPSQVVDPTKPYENCKTTSYFMAPYFSYMTMLKMAEICKCLGVEEDGKVYLEFAAQAKEAIQQGLMYGDLLPKDLMGAYVVAFAFDLVPEDLYDEYKNRLVSLIKENGNCLNTGFLATPYILESLYKIGEKELALKVLWQDKMPSWFYEVDHGATAIWEAWEADEARATGRYISYDHYALGCVDDWICRKICGLDSDTPGFRHILIEPDTEAGIEFCKRVFISEAGKIEINWNQENLQVEIPCNTTATITWKGNVYEVGSGSYSF